VEPVVDEFFLLHEEDNSFLDFSFAFLDSGDDAATDGLK
jgi:hypothetical protein